MSTSSMLFAMGGWGITGCVIGGLFLLLLLINAKDIARYIKISNM